MDIEERCATINPMSEPSDASGLEFLAFVSPAGRARRWAKLLATFMTGQMLVQGIGLITGFTLLRWMSVEAYAQYTVALAFQSTVNLLVDVGFNGCILGLVGERGDDSAVIEGYIRVSRTYRGRMFYIVGGISGVVFPLVVAHQPWPWWTKGVLLISVFAAVFFNGWDVYRAPLLIRRRIAETYRADVIPASLRLGLTTLFHAAGVLFGWVGSWTNAFAYMVTGFLLRRYSRNILTQEDTRNHVSLADEAVLGREIVDYLKPIWPGMIRFALQGQITTVLSSITGSSANLAGIGALGRINQLFVFVGGIGPTLLIPKIAACSRTEIKKAYASIVTVYGVLLMAIAATGYLFPRPLMVLLGSKYLYLQPLIGFALLSGAIGTLAGTVNAINNTRRWITMRSSWAGVILSTGVQVLCMVFGNISSVRGLLWLNFWMAAAELLIGISRGFTGLKNARDEHEFEAQAASTG